MLSDELSIPVKIGDRVVGRGFLDEDDVFHCIIDEADVREFLDDNHGLTCLSINDGYAEIELIDE